jgi:hypothetical protein
MNRIALCATNAASGSNYAIVPQMLVSIHDACSPSVTILNGPGRQY